MYDKTAFVYIQRQYPSTIHKEQFVSHSGFAGPGGIPTSALRINIQPASDQMTLMYDGVIGKTFVGFTTASGLAEGMRITVSGTTETYTVKGRKDYSYGPLPHNEVVLFKGNPQ